MVSRISLMALVAALFVCASNFVTMLQQTTGHYMDEVLASRSVQAHAHPVSSISRHNTEYPQDDLFPQLTVRGHYFQTPSSSVLTTDVSIMTQFSLDRYPQFLDLSQQWKGHISAAVYLNSSEIPQITKLYNELPVDSKISFHLVLNTGNYTGEYPINFMRNVALDFAVTDYVFLVDVDFLPNPDAHSQILEQIHDLDMEHKPNQALVIPAFEREVRGKSQIIKPSQLPKTKNALRELIFDERDYFTFHRQYRPNHAATDYQKWYRTGLRYPIQFRVPFEPFVVVHRKAAPRFYSAFTGYGYARKSWAEELAVSGFRFHVIPNSFLIHINHEHKGPFKPEKRPISIQNNEIYQQFHKYIQDRYQVIWPPPKVEDNGCNANTTTRFPGISIQPHYFGPPNNFDTKDVSIMTQITMDKFERVLDLHSRWNGYMSVAVYLTAPYQDDLNLLKQLRNQHFHNNPNVSFHLVLHEGTYIGDYPINVMRNVAMDYAVTDYVFMLDVDFIPSPDTHANMLRYIQYSKTKNWNHKIALIVPAFEREIQRHENVTIHQLPTTKKELVRLLNDDSSQYFTFHRQYSPGHGPTNYPKWYAVQRKTYSIDYQLYYEPYVMVNRAAANGTLPRFFEGFTGFGRNKQSWIEELAAAGYQFKVMPNSFLIHINHHYGAYVGGMRAMSQDTIRQYYQVFRKCLSSTYNRKWPPPELEDSGWR